MNTVYVIRHAEKPDAALHIAGVNAQGQADAAELSVRGWQRTGALIQLFSPTTASLCTSPRFQAPQHLFASAPTLKSRRPVRTIEPLASALHLQIDQRFKAGADEAALARALAQLDGVALVSWRHAHMAALGRQLTASGAQIPEWDESRFDVTWVFHATRERAWHFEQHPQRLLPGDLPTLIKVPP